MAETFAEIGFARDGSPLCFTEIAAFRSLSARRLDPWEARILRLMSIEYLEGRRIGEKSLGVPPWEPS